jgi:DNA-binding transcriptional LysR family regulator
MNLSSIDLNLLLVFRAIMHHRNVTRAGQEIGLSQPATSNALNRLRHHYKDPLFLRTRGGMDPTIRARELAPAIEEALSKIELTLPITGAPSTMQEFEPSTVEKKFNIMFVDYGGLHLISRLAEVLIKEAPGMEVSTHLGDADTAITKLQQAEIDLAIGVLSLLPVGWKRRNLFMERIVAAVSRHHPRIVNRLTAEDYTQERHVGITPRGINDRLLADHGVSRRFAVSATMLSVPFVVARTDLLATLPSGVARTFSDMFGLAVFELPFRLGGCRICMVNHPRTDSDKPLAWLMGRIEDIANELRSELGLDQAE